MAENERVRIADIAEELGVSTATVSNVIHGKTKKISDETVKRVQLLLEERKYIPSMAGILLAQNNSRIIGVIINDHEKYEGRVLEDPFISSAVNYLSYETDKNGYFLMIKITTETSDIIRFASMWNVSGMVLIGFCCDQDYDKLRSSIRIPFVVYDGFFDKPNRISNITIDNFDGGYQVGKHFAELGHKKLLCISDNFTCMDLERWNGFKKAAKEHALSADYLQIPLNSEERIQFYEEKMNEIKMYSAVFAVSDFYAVELMQFLMENGIKIPGDISISGFDDTPICRQIAPSLTSVHQDCKSRAKTAVSVLKELQKQEKEGSIIRLPVELITRNSTAKYTKQLH